MVIACRFPLLSGRPAGGIVHLCNPPACTWYEFACETLRLIGSPVRPQPIRLVDLPGLQAPRPDNSALDPEYFEGLIGHPCRAWPEALTSHLQAST